MLSKDNISLLRRPTCRRCRPIFVSDLGTSPRTTLVTLLWRTESRKFSKRPDIPKEMMSFTFDWLKGKHSRTFVVSSLPVARSLKTGNGVPLLQQSATRQVEDVERSIV